MVRETHPLRCQRIKMRGSNQGLPEAPQFTVTQIVSGDVNNIGAMNFRAMNFGAAPL